MKKSDTITNIELDTFNDFVKEVKPENLDLRILKNKSPFSDGKNFMLMSGNKEIWRLNFKEVITLTNIVIELKNVK